MVELLLEFGANINKQNSRGNTALFLAAENVNPLERAVLLGQVETSTDLSLVELLVEQGAEKDLGDVDGVTPIMIATIKGHTEVVRFLMEGGASLNERDVRDHTIIHFAAMNNRHKVLSVLAADNEEVVAVLANLPNHMENTALHLAAQAGNLETVRELLDGVYQVDVDNKNWDEQTPSHLAAAEGHSDVLKLLLQSDPNAIFDKDEEDNTPLHLAATRKQSSTVETLLAAGEVKPKSIIYGISTSGASFQKRNRAMWTPLDCAAAAGSLLSSFFILLMFF